MKKIFISILTAAAVGMTSCRTDSSKCDNQATCANDNICTVDTCCNATPEEIAGIRKALDLYAEAAIKGDSKIARAAFAPTATMSYAEGDSLVSVPIQALYDYYDQTGPHNATYEISACNVAYDVAIVRIESKFGETEFADMFTLVKDDPYWKILSKVYHVK